MDVESEWREAFARALTQDVLRSGLQVTYWAKAGAMKPETLVSMWHELGPKVIRNYIDWFESPDNPWIVWQTPDGQLAVELELEVKFGYIPVVMAIDVVLENVETGELMVLDLKSGAKEPETVQQLGFYACGLELAYGIRPELGAHFMARGVGRNQDVFLTDPVELGEPEFSVQFFTKQLEAMERSILVNGFTARRGKHCTMCPVQEYCAANGGIASWMTDPDHPHYHRNTR